MKKNQIPTFSPYEENNDPPSNEILTPDKRTGMAEQYIDLSSNQPVNTPSPTANVSSIIESGLSSPYFDQIRQNEQRRMVLTTMPTVDKNGRGKSGLKALVEGLSTYFDPKFGLVRGWGDFGARLAGAGGKAVGGLINPAWDEEADKQKEIAKIDLENERLKNQGEWESKMNTQETQRQNILVDNQRQQQMLNDRKTADEEKRKLEHDKFTESKRRNWYSQNKYFHPESATEAQRKQLAEFGETPETVGIYDFTKPETKTVGGTVYKLNRNTSNYEPTNLPSDGSKALVEYSVKDPDTDIEYKFTTTSEKAASLKTSLRAAGLQIQAANERQVNSQNFTAGENEKNRQTRLQIENANKSMTSKDLLARMQQYAKDKDVSLEEAKQAFKAQGVNVDEILQRQ